MSIYTGKYSAHVGATSGYAGFRNRRRLTLFSKLISVNKNDDILEIGPNKGLLLDALKEKANSVIGIDINKEAVEKATRSYILYMNAENLEFKDESFHTVIGIEVFEHIHSLEKVFSEISRVLKTDGKCYMTVPLELFRGQQALGDAWHTYRDLRMCRQLHVHKLNPAKIKKLISHTHLEITISRIVWIPAPSFYIVLTKKPELI